MPPELFNMKEPPPGGEEEEEEEEGEEKGEEEAEMAENKEDNENKPCEMNDDPLEADDLISQATSGPKGEKSVLELKGQLPQLPLENIHS